MGELKTNLTLQQAHSSAAPPPSPLATASPKLHPQQQPQHSPATSSGTADSDVPGAQLPTARHLDIHLTMRDQQYIAQSLQHPDGLSGTTSLPEAAQSSAAPPTSIYSSALTPYSNVCRPPIPISIKAEPSSSFSLGSPNYIPNHTPDSHTLPDSQVSSFNYPAQCDSTLLTPISSAGSPPLHQGQKLGQQYPPPPTTPHQEHTPPNTDKMYTQWSQFDMQGQTSQTSSPMTAPAPVAPEFHMQGYMEDRRTPGPPEPYLGNYGVSNGPDQANIEHPYYVPMQPMEHATTLLMRDASGLEPEPHHGRPLPSTPLLNQPHPSHFRPSRRSSVEFHHHHPDGSRSMSGSPRRKPATHGNSRVKKRPSRRQSASQKSSSPKDPMDEHKNCHGLEVPPQLKPSCTEIDRMVVEARWKFRNKRGNDMWQLIQDEIQSKTGKKHGREDLQMKFRRSRLHIEWYPEDVSLPLPPYS